MRCVEESWQIPGGNFGLAHSGNVADVAERSPYDQWLRSIECLILCCCLTTSVDEDGKGRGEGIPGSE